MPHEHDVRSQRPHRHSELFVGAEVLRRQGADDLGAMPFETPEHTGDHGVTGVLQVADRRFVHLKQVQKGGFVEPLHDRGVAARAAIETGSNAPTSDV
jgi:hypothetical protein